MQRLGGEQEKLTEQEASSSALSEDFCNHQLVTDFCREIEVWLDVTGRCVWSNPTAIELTGYTVDDLQPYADFTEVLIAEEDRDRVRAAIASALTGQGGTALEFGYLPRSGGVRRMRVSWVPVYNRNHGLEGIQIRGLDTTALRNTPDDVKNLIFQQRALLNGLPHIALLVGRDWRILVSNQVAQATKSKSAAFFWEALGIDGDPETDVALRQLIDLSNECLRTGTARSFKNVKYSCGLYDLHWVPFCADSFFLYAEDVTTEREAALALDRAEKHSRLITEVVLQGIIQIDPAGRVVFANPAALHLSGYSEMEMGRATIQMLFAGGASMLKDKGRELIAGKPVVGEDTLISKDGRCIPVFLSHAPLINNDGQYQGFICSVVDISLRKKSEAELVRLSAAVNQTDEGIIITEESGRILYVNPAFERLSGYAKQDVIGKTPRVFKSGRHDDLFYKQMWSTVMSGHPWTGRLVNRRKDGQLYTGSCVISPFRDPESRQIYFVAFQRDISEELKQEDQYRQLQKMTALGRLAGGVAHDFNNILQGIFGLCDIILMGGFDVQEQLQCVNDIREEARRGGELTRQLLAFSRKDPQSFSEVDVSQLVAAQRKMLQRLLGEQIKLVYSNLKADSVVSAVPSQLEQVLMNLCVNARDAMPGGGELSVAVSEAFFEENDRSEGSGDHAGRYVCLSVSDTGTGMSEDVREHLFEPFFTTKTKDKGTGLGLSLVFGVVKQHNGWIHVRSEEGKGSEFKVFLPVFGASRKIVRRDAGTSELSCRIDGDGDHVLLIEDDPMVRKLSIRVFEQNGFRVSCAENADEAQDFFAREDGQFDLLFSDIVLPGRSGYEMAKEFSEKNPTLPVILCSGFYDEVVSLEEIHSAGFLFLQKPFSFRQMLEMVSQALHKELKEQV